MKHILLYSLSLSCLYLNTCSSAFAQACSNLIVNGNFETQKVAAGSNLNGHLLNIAGYYNNPDELSNWELTFRASIIYSSSNVDPGTSYYALNAPSGSNTNPNSTPYGPFTPFQPASGPDNGGTLGIWSYPTNPGQSSYATQELSTPLRGDRSYYASMQVRRARRTAYYAYAGMYITVANPKNPPSGTTEYGPSSPPNGCGFQSASAITSATSWTRISNVFPGVSGAKYINLGNFNAGANLPVDPNDPNYYYYGEAYNFIDDVQLYQIPTAGNNTTTACGYPITIGEGCTIPGATYTWSAPGVTGLPTNSLGVQTSITPTSTNTYTLTVNLPNGQQQSSQVTITIADPSSLSLTAYVDGQQVASPSRIDQSYNTEVNIYTPVTFMVSGNSNATCTWSVYTSAGPYSYTSSVSGNTFSITPRAPQSPTAPGGATNYAQYYGITCTVSYPGCNTSSNLEFGLYSKQSSGSGGGGVGDQGDPDLGYRSAGATSAYPNPASESITIPEGAKEATLLNSKGKTLLKADASGQLNVQSLPGGLYNLQMMQNGKLINQRIQVKH